MKILDHPNICKLYESFQDHRSLSNQQLLPHPGQGEASISRSYFFFWAWLFGAFLTASHTSRKWITHGWPLQPR